MYAQLPVYQYQTFGSENLAFSNVPLATPPTAPVRYYGVVTDLSPKSDEVLEKPPPDAEAIETPAEPPPEPAVAAEGQISCPLSLFSQS